MPANRGISTLPLVSSFQDIYSGCCTVMHRSRKNKGRAPFRGWLPYRYVFSSCMVNPSFLQTRT